MSQALEQRVLVRDLLNWAHRVGAVLPPIAPALVSSKRVSLAALLEGIELGIRLGEEGHLVRAAQWLLEQGVPSDAQVRDAIRHDRIVFTARQLLRAHARDFWQDRLLRAAASGELRALPPLPSPPAAARS